MLQEKAKIKGDCQCEKCKALCKKTPGWFLPGEATTVAEYLGMTLEDLFCESLVIDFYMDDDKEIDILSPAKDFNRLAKQSHQELLKPWDYAGNKVSWGWAFYRAACVFYKDGLCQIHPVKPHECRMSYACEDFDNRDLREEMAKIWDKKKAQDELRRVREVIREEGGVY